MVICRFRGDKLDITIEKPPSSGFLPFRGDKLNITVKEIIPLGEIGSDHKLYGEIDISFGCYMEEIVRGILLT